MMNERETIFQAGDETLGGKRKFERERERRSFAIWLETTHSADAPGTRKVALPGRRLNEASPTGPGSHGSEPLCRGCVVLPEAILRCPGQKKCPYCPYFSTQTPRLESPHP